MTDKPVVLWNTSRRHTNSAIDDGGVAVKKSVLAPAVRATTYTGRTFVGAVPSLAYFCIIALSAHPDQLHTLGHFRLSYRDDVVRALLPPRGKCQTQSSSAHSLPLDPRIWSTLAQVMHPLPEQLHDLELPLADIHLPLLQQIPSTPDFSMVTLLALPNCKEVCDETVSELRRLNGLVALDLRGTAVSAYGITVLVRGLSWSNDDAGSKRRAGLWGLRILRLHSCTNIDNKVLPTLRKFPLLSAIDLRFTRCTGSALNRHLGEFGFRPQYSRNLFHPAPLSLALCTLENIATDSPTPASLYSCSLPSVFRIHVNKLFPSPRSHSTVSVATSSVRYPTGAAKVIRTISTATEDTVVFIPPVTKSSPSLSTEFSAVQSHKPASTRSFLTNECVSQESEPRRLNQHHPASESNRSSVSWHNASDSDVDPNQVVLKYEQVKQCHRVDDGPEQGGVCWEDPQNEDYGNNEEICKSEKGHSKLANGDNCNLGPRDANWYERYPPERSHTGLFRTTPMNSPASVDTAARRISPSLRRVKNPLLSRRLSSFYRGKDSAERLSPLPASACSARSPDDSQSDPLAVARPPPSWDTLDVQIHSPHHNATINTHREVSVPTRMSGTPQQPTEGGRTGVAEINHARLSQRNAGAVNDMLDALASKKFKVEHRLSDCPKKQVVKSHNPFAKSARSVFPGRQPLNSEKTRPGPRFIAALECERDSAVSSRQPRT